MKTLLIIDDEADIVECLKDLLSENVDRVLVAYDGKEALEVLMKEEVNCIISDINMPKMTGMELAQEMKERNISIPFIFYTAYSDKKLKEQATSLGINEYYNKPELNGLELAVDKITGVH